MNNENELIETFNEKVLSDGNGGSGTYGKADPTHYEKGEAYYEAEAGVYKIEVVDVTWGIETTIGLVDQESWPSTPTICQAYYDTATGQPNKPKQLIMRDDYEKEVFLAIFGELIDAYKLEKKDLMDIVFQD